MADVAPFDAAPFDVARFGWPADIRAALLAVFELHPAPKVAMVRVVTTAARVLDHVRRRAPRPAAHIGWQVVMRRTQPVKPGRTAIGWAGEAGFATGTGTVRGGIVAVGLGRGSADGDGDGVVTGVLRTRCGAADAWPAIIRPPEPMIAAITTAVVLLNI